MTMTQPAKEMEHPLLEWTKSGQKEPFIDFLQSRYGRKVLYSWIGALGDDKHKRLGTIKPNEVYDLSNNKKVIRFDEVFEDIDYNMVFPVQGQQILDYIYSNLSVEPAKVEAIRKQLKRFQQYNERYNYDVDDADTKTDMTDARLIALSYAESAHSRLNFDLNNDYYIQAQYRPSQRIKNDANYGQYIASDGTIYKPQKSWDDEKEKDEAFKKEKEKQKRVFMKSYIENMVKRIMVESKIYSKYNQNGVNLIGRCSWFSGSSDNGRGWGVKNHIPQLSLKTISMLKVKKPFEMNLSSNQSPREIREKINKNEIIPIGTLFWAWIMSSILHIMFGESEAEIAQQGLLSNDEWNVALDIVIDDMIKNPNPIVDDRRSYGGGVRNLGTMLNGNYQLLTAFFVGLIQHQYLCEVNGVIPFSPPSTIDLDSKGIFLTNLEFKVTKKDKSEKGHELRKVRHMTNMSVSFDLPEGVDVLSYRIYALNEENIQQLIGRQNIPYTHGDVRLIIPKTENMDVIWDFSNESLDMVADAILQDLKEINKRMKIQVKKSNAYELKKFIEDMDAHMKPTPKEAHYGGGAFVDKNGNKLLIEGGKEWNEFTRWLKRFISQTERYGLETALILPSEDSGSTNYGTSGMTNQTLYEEIIKVKGKKKWDSVVKTHLANQKEHMDSYNKEQAQRKANTKDITQEFAKLK
jgi:hypothetical protein